MTRIELDDGVMTTLHILRIPPQTLTPRVVVMPRPQRLRAWCAESGTANAVIGGFFVRPEGTPLGEVRVRGRRQPSRAFEAPWDRIRSCVHIEDGVVRIARRPDFPADPGGDLLQAGPLLVRGGEIAMDGEDSEGFSAASHQFDSDITAGRYPRAALGVTVEGDLLAVVSEGRSDSEAGLALGELAGALVGLRAVDAINLDGGGSASLVFDGRLINRPREDHGVELAGGRPLSTALVFDPV